jgi:hypothetical protein
VGSTKKGEAAMVGVGGAPESSLQRRRPRATTRSLDRADRNKVAAPLDDDAEESQRTTGSHDRSSSDSIKVLPHRRRDEATTTNNTTSRRTRTTVPAPTIEDVEDPPSLLADTTFADVGIVGHEKEQNNSSRLTKRTTDPDPPAAPRPPALIDLIFEEDDDDRDDDDEDDDNDNNDEHEQEEEPASSTMDGTADGAGSKKTFPLDASPPDCAETTFESGTVDDSLFSDRYSLTVSHHQKVTCIVKPHNRHATAVQQLRQTRNEHRQQQQPKAQDHIATNSGSSTSWSASSDEAITFLGNLKTVVADLSYFFDSLKESLTEPHNIIPCSFTTPTEISYQRRRRHRHRQKTMKPQRSRSRSHSRSRSRKR